MCFLAAVTGNNYCFECAFCLPPSDVVVLAVVVVVVAVVVGCIVGVVVVSAVVVIVAVVGVLVLLVVSLPLLVASFRTFGGVSMRGSPSYGYRAVR